VVEVDDAEKLLDNWGGGALGSSAKFTTPACTEWLLRRPSEQHRPADGAEGRGRGLTVPRQCSFSTTWRWPPTSRRFGKRHQVIARGGGRRTRVGAIARGGGRSQRPLSVYARGTLSTLLRPTVSVDPQASGRHGELEGVGASRTSRKARLRTLPVGCPRPSVDGPRRRCSGPRSSGIMIE
jgi:hypothetical protein